MGIGHVLVKELDDGGRVRRHMHAREFDASSAP